MKTFGRQRDIGKGKQGLNEQSPSTDLASKILEFANNTNAQPMSYGRIAHKIEEELNIYIQGFRGMDKPDKKYYEEFSFLHEADGVLGFEFRFCGMEFLQVCEYNPFTLEVFAKTFRFKFDQFKYPERRLESLSGMTLRFKTHQNFGVLVPEFDRPCEEDLFKKHGRQHGYLIQLRSCLV